MYKNRPGRVLPAIVIAQFLGTSLWFAGNAVIGYLQADLDLGEHALGHLTSAVQFGFISGTLSFALLTIADRYSPSKVFFLSALAGALANVAIAFLARDFWSLMGLRFLTGFFLAGIYPVGMKIAADYHKEGLGKALGFLVGALVLGTAFPHLLNALTSTLSWKYVMVFTSACALLGGLMILALPDGPYRTRGKGTDLSAFFSVFKYKGYRAAAFGYFGHMWEIYTFWAFVPVMLSAYIAVHPGASYNIPLLSFLIIATGFVSCSAGGLLSLKVGSGRVAFYSLLISASCCLLSYFMLDMPLWLFIGFLLLWGSTVGADSPQFSTLAARGAPPDKIGTALTIMNCIGFAITIVSIEVVQHLIVSIPFQYVFLVMVIGPALGLVAMRRVITS